MNAIIREYELHGKHQLVIDLPKEFDAEKVRVTISAIIQPEKCKKLPSEYFAEIRRLQEEEQEEFELPVWKERANAFTDYDSPAL